MREVENVEREVSYLKVNSEIHEYITWHNLFY